MNELETRYAAALDRADDHRLDVESAAISPNDDAWWGTHLDALATAHREMARRLTLRAQQRRRPKNEEPPAQYYEVHWWPNAMTGACQSPFDRDSAIAAVENFERQGIPAEVHAVNWNGDRSVITKTRLEYPPEGD